MVFQKRSFCMKFKNILAMAIASLGLASISANADIIIKSTQGVAQDSCSNVAGVWTGKGTVSYGKLKCGYSGNAVVTASADPTQFIMNVSLDKTSGACPSHEEFVLPAVCKDGAIVIQNEDANLNGTLSNDGNTADLTGTVNIPIGGSVVTANVDSMHLDKKQ
jgi:hypothetical protein